MKGFEKETQNQKYWEVLALMQGKDLACQFEK